MPVTTLHDFFSMYQKRRLSDRSKLTAVQYVNTIKVFGRFIGTDSPTLEDITEDTWSEWKSHMLEEGMSRATINKHRRHLLTLLNWGREWRQTTSTVTSKSLTPVDELLGSPVAWTVEEIGRLLDAAHRSRGRVGAIKLSDFWTALILTIYDTGARKGVLLTITPREWFPAERAICLPACKQKQKTTQWCLVTPQTVDAINRIYCPDAQWLFNWTHDRHPTASWNWLNRCFRELVLAAGLDIEHGLFHRIRRTSASYKHKYSPGSATYELGHSSSRVTERYLDPRIIGGSKIVDLMPRPSFAM